MNDGDVLKLLKKILKANVPETIPLAARPRVGKAVGCVRGDVGSGRAA